MGITNGQASEPSQQENRHSNQQTNQAQNQAQNQPINQHPGKEQNQASDPWSGAECTESSPGGQPLAASAASEAMVGEAGGIWLAMDTSTASLTIAVMQGESVLGAVSSHAERNHSIYLLPMIEQLLQSLGMTPRDLNGIAVGRGPGSYTGVRIAITVAKTFAWSLGLPLTGVSSLEALAYSGWLDLSGSGNSPTWFIPLMDARRGQVYTSLYCLQDGVWKPVEEDGIRLMHRWTEQVFELCLPGAQPESVAGDTANADEADRATGCRRPSRLVFIGDAAMHREAIAELRSKLAAAGDASAAIEIVELDTLLQAQAVGALAFRYGTSLRGDAVHGFVPNYTQLTEAEAKLLGRRQ